MIPARGITGIIQARMGSTRLPQKTLTDISGRPLLWHVVERVRASELLENVVIATTTEPADDVIERFSEESEITIYRGSTHDVLDRYYQAACLSPAKIVVRITADDPFKDPEILDRIVRQLLDDTSLDYVSNTIEPTYPEGLDIEAMTFQTLERAWREAVLPSEREHVTPYIYNHPDIFKLFNMRHHDDLSHLRWTIDYPEDLDFTREVYDRLYPGGVFLMQEILDLLHREPDLIQLNAGISRNESYQASLANEQEQLRKKSGAES